MKEKTQQTAIVPTTKTTAELILGQTAELIEKSFAENTIRNRRRNRHDRLTTLRHLTMPKKILSHKNIVNIG